MKHKSTTDYQHFLDDLAGMYPQIWDFLVKKGTGTFFDLIF